jgi:putative ABC transport system substrate-binding protein
MAVRRREFIALIGGAATWPHGVHAEQSGVPVIGVLGSTSADGYSAFLGAFRQGLNAAGYIEGQNVAIEYRWAEGRYERLPALAAELVRRRVAVIATIGGTPAALAAKQATSIIPIVFAMSADPVNLGFVSSLNNPMRNATGVTLYVLEMEAKKVELMSELVPKADIMALLVNPNSPVAQSQAREASGAARVLGRHLHILNAAGAGDFEGAFGALKTRRAGALIIGADPVFLTLRQQLIALANRHVVPTICPWREFVVGGGLASYGNSLMVVYREQGVYVGQVLGGAKPSELPIRRANKFELVLNLKTAKALGLTVAPLMLARADEVIE